MRLFVKIIPLTPYKKNKKIDFAASNKSIMANKLPSTNLEQFLRRIEFLLTREQMYQIGQNGNL